MTKRYLGAALAALLISLPASVQAHCQIPCGIYDDNARVVSMLVYLIITLHMRLTGHI